MFFSFFYSFGLGKPSRTRFLCFAMCLFRATLSSSTTSALFTAALVDGWQTNSTLLSLTFSCFCCRRDLSLVPAKMMFPHSLLSPGSNFDSSRLNLFTALIFLLCRVYLTVWIALNVLMFMLVLPSFPSLNVPSLNVNVLWSMMLPIILKEDSTNGPWNIDIAAFTAWHRPGYFPV